MVPSRLRWALRSWLLVSLSAACSAGPSGDGPIANTSSAIIDGVPSPPQQDFVVDIVHPVTGGAFICSGSLIAPNLVLTARHCVSTVPDEGFSCDSSGTGTDGGTLGADFDPQSLYIYTGTQAPSEFSTPASFGSRIFHDDATNLCNHDLALIEISPPITGIAVATLDLDSKVSGGDSITAIGWGIIEDGGTPSDRLEREGIAVLDVGPASDSAGFDVASNEFDVGESVCSGDSGGPGMSSANAIVGVVSRGGNGVLDAAVTDPAATCLGAVTINIYTETSAFRDLILGTFAEVGSTPVLVGVALGEACTESTECASKLCAVAGAEAGLTCTQDCSSTSCPDGARCNVYGGASLCVPAPSSGCSVEAPRSTESSPDPAAAGFAGLAVLGLVARKRRAPPRHR